MMFLQATADVVDNRYPCKDKDSLTLAALQVQEQYGDYPESGKDFASELRGTDELTGKPKLAKFLSENYIPENRERMEELTEQITRLYAKLSGYTVNEARLSYLDYVKSWKIYGSTYFLAEPVDEKSSKALDFPASVILAINAKGIIIVDPDTRDFLAEYTYKDVDNWGHSTSSFVVVTKGTKIYFKTERGKELNSMIKVYVGQKG